MVLKKGFDYRGNVLIENPEFMDLMGKMLEMNPGKRIGPKGVLRHLFCKRE